MKIGLLAAATATTTAAAAAAAAAVQCNCICELRKKKKGVKKCQKHTLSYFPENSSKTVLYGETRFLSNDKLIKIKEE